MECKIYIRYYFKKKTENKKRKKGQYKKLGSWYNSTHKFSSSNAIGVFCVFKLRTRPEV